MPAYHSQFLALAGVKEVAGLAVLPVKTKKAGPAPMVDVAAAEEDIVDESLRLFRANVLFRNFEVLGSADRVLIYLTFFIHQCIKKVEKVGSKPEALRTLTALGTGAPFAPGDAGWPLGGHFPAPKGAEADELRAYLKQLREALVPKLVDRLYSGEGGAPNKFWMAFAKRKFLNKEFP